jgi:hypothetical protein
MTHLRKHMSHKKTPVPHPWGGTGALRKTRKEEKGGKKPGERRRKKRNPKKRVVK